MAELTTPAETTASSCCAPEAQVACCAPSAKTECCDPSHGEGCGCPAGNASSIISVPSTRSMRTTLFADRVSRLLTC
jgi:hypothetical protein